jgi:hypothetical protein
MPASGAGMDAGSGKPLAAYSAVHLERVLIFGFQAFSAAYSAVH